MNTLSAMSNRTVKKIHLPMPVIIPMYVFAIGNGLIGIKRAFISWAILLLETIAISRRVCITTALIICFQVSMMTLTPHKTVLMHLIAFTMMKPTVPVLNLEKRLADTMLSWLHITSSMNIKKTISASRSERFRTRQFHLPSKTLFV